MTHRLAMPGLAAAILAVSLSGTSPPGPAPRAQAAADEAPAPPTPTPGDVHLAAAREALAAGDLKVAVRELERARAWLSGAARRGDADAAGALEGVDGLLIEARAMRMSGRYAGKKRGGR